MIVNKNSWHYQLNNLSTDWSIEGNYNTICSYFILTCITIIKTVLLIGLILTFVFGLLFVLFTFWVDVILLFASFILVFFIITVFISVCKYLAKVFDDSLLVNRYNSWKNNYCAKVEFKG